jgi:hypothetical protein
MAKPIDRREFIKNAAAAGASLAFLPDEAIRGEERPAARQKTSRVVAVNAPGVVNEEYRPDEKRLRRMVDLGVARLTGESDPAAAWKRIVNPDDVVGIKINSWGGRLISSKRSIMMAVADGVRKAGVPANRIIVWDQHEENLREYMRIQKIDREADGIRFEACSPQITPEAAESRTPPDGFDTEPVRFPWGELRLAELVADRLTAIINLAVLKDHLTAGVSGTLKNISHAVVDRPWHCHDNFCNPYIADIVNIPRVRRKLRLHVLDGVLGVAASGPQLLSLDHLLTKESLLLSADPVALDRIGYDWVVRAREEKGFSPMETRTDRAPGMKGIPAAYISTAAARGLGTNDLKSMEIVKIRA